MRQNLLRRYPEATEPEIDRPLQAWLRERPGPKLAIVRAAQST
jgi:hypothetical protein